MMALLMDINEQDKSSLIMTKIHLKLVRVLIFAFLFTAISGPSWAQSSTNKDKNEDIISLHGIWGFQLDPLNEGIHNLNRSHWPTKDLAETITLPGSTDEAGRGYKTHDKVPWRLNRLYKYKGAAWYSKKIHVPDDWKGRELQLFLERVHWETRVWVNGKAAGMHESLSVPHIYDVTSLIKPGQDNFIMIRVDNDLKYNIGFFGHSVTEETQTNWNGIIGKIQLRALNPVNIADVQVYPDVKQKSARVKLTVENRLKEQVRGDLKLSAKSYNTDQQDNIPEHTVSFSGSDSLIHVETTLPMGDDVLLWDEFHPALYHLKTQLTARSGSDQFVDDSQVAFGMRSFKADGTQFEVNGRTTFIRGTLNCAPFPITGYPPAKIKDWMRIFKINKEYGINSMRFHSWTPPEAAFEAADRMGFYLQVELPNWTPRTSGSDPEVNQFLEEESERILKTYGNHPSFAMLCTGNELGGPDVKPFVTKMVKKWKGEDPRHLYTSSAGYPMIPENDFDNLYGPRAQEWGEELNGRFNKEPLSTEIDYSKAVAQKDVPIVSHEVGQWCAYPNFDEISKYTGVLRAYNFEIFRESLRKHRMLDQAHKFLMASGKFQILQYKEEIETALRTPGFGGYQLLGLHDFPGQGTALVGVLDAFWDPKPYVNASIFQEFQGSRVPLLETDSFTWTSDQTFKAQGVFANYGPSDIEDAQIHWSITFPDGRNYAEGNFQSRDIPVNGPINLGNIEVPLHKIRKATQLTVTLNVPGTSYKNHWDIWVYPKKLSMPGMNNVTVAHEWSRKVRRTLQRGDKVLLLADTSKIDSEVPPGFSSIFWNTNWTNNQAPHTLGILCDPDNPALSDFPTKYYSTWQWWDLVDHSRPMVLDQLPGNMKPMVQMIDDWNKNRKLGLAFEAKVGKGKLLMTSIDLQHNLENRPVARQMLYSLENYANSDQFNPKFEVDPAKIQQLFK